MKKTDGISLASDLSALQELHAFCEALKSKMHLGEQLHENIMLVLSEAATNAIIHGNENNPGKKVDVEVYEGDQQIVIVVSDEGEGFDPTTLPDPLSEENLLRQGGRGVFLIEQFADHVEYRDKGSTVILTFNRQSSA